jgi:signal peptidase II
MIEGPTGVSNGPGSTDDVTDDATNATDDAPDEVTDDATDATAAGPAAEADGRDARAAERRHWKPFLAVAALVVAADQATKSWAVDALDDRVIDLVGSLRLRLVLNDGAAFSLVGGRTTVVALIALAVTAVVLRFGLRSRRPSWAVGFGLIFGGASGNLVDRALRDGEGFLGGRVVDFVDLQWWPVFNVADAALVLGVGIVFLLSLRDDPS